MPNVPDCCVVLAAGEGTRMEDPLPKVLHRVGNRTMVDRVLGTLKSAGIGRIITIVGFGREAVEAELRVKHPDSLVAVQKEQLGTGHAVRCAMPLVADDVRTVGVFSGDTPLLSVQVVHELAGEHFCRGAGVTLLTAELSDPSGYGRIVRNGEGLVERIVEEKDARPDELTIVEINAGAYIFDRKILEDTLTMLRDDNVQGEFYLTDTIVHIRTSGHPVAAFKAPGDAAEVLGVNTVEQLLQADLLIRDRESDR